jgi:hypothetical protein
MKLLLRDLAFGPATIKDLVDTIGVGQRQLYQYLRVAREDGKVRIVGWEAVPGGRPIYGRQGVVRLPDIQRPGRQSFAENKRRWREKRRRQACVAQTQPNYAIP